MDEHYLQPFIRLRDKPPGDAFGFAPKPCIPEEVRRLKQENEYLKFRLARAQSKRN